MNETIFKSISDFDGICKYARYKIDGKETDYYVLDSGEVYSTKHNKFKKIKPQKQKHGYMLVHLHVNNKSVYKWLHRMVAETFIPNPENKPEVNHKDGDKENNDVSNLEWNTSKENIDHAFENELRKCGEDSSHAKITNDDARKICELLVENKKTMNEIAKEVGCSVTTVFNIKKKKNWLDVSKDYDIDSYNVKEPVIPKLTKKDVIEIYKKLKSDKYTTSEIANEYNVTVSTIYGIKNKMYWKSVTDKIDILEEI